MSGAWKKALDARARRLPYTDDNRSLPVHAVYWLSEAQEGLHQRDCIEAAAVYLRAWRLCMHENSRPESDYSVIPEADLLWIALLHISRAWFEPDTETIRYAEDALKEWWKRDRRKQP